MNQEDIHTLQQQISDLQATNELLKHSEERYHKMVGEIEEYAIILLDPDGIIQNWNKGAEKIKQYSEQEAVGQHFQMFYLPEDRARRLPNMLIERARTEGRALHEGWRIRRDGTKFWGSITLTALHGDNGEVIGFSKITRDLTDKKMADDRLAETARQLQETNEALRKSEERYHKMISEVEDYAILLLNEKGDVQNWNVGAEKIKGYSAKEIVGKNFSIFYTPEDRQRNLPQQLLKQAATTGKAVHEGWRVRKDGSMFWGSIVMTALHDDQNQVIGFSKVTRDLTERKHAEDKMQRYLHDLEAQNRELEQFVYIASHDLQEPLRKIQLFINVLEKNLHDEKLTRDYFNRTTKSAQRMAELIRSVLNYSRLSVSGEQLADIDLEEVLKTVVSDFELVINEKKALIKSGRLPRIRGIHLQIVQLFSNIIGNAMKFSETAPVILIASKLVTAKEMVHRPEHLTTGNFVEISFADNGIGFDQQFAQRIFAMFQRLNAKDSYAGTGIGLALCKKIMENHRGYITAVGENLKGATFYVYFPL